MDRACIAHGKMRNTKFWETGIDGKLILEWILGKYGRKVWTGCIWLKIGMSVRVL
jgi:hypothetical protein